MTPSSSGLGHHPFTVGTRVRLPWESLLQLHVESLVSGSVYVSFNVLLPRMGSIGIFFLYILYIVLNY